MRPATAGCLKIRAQVEDLMKAMDGTPLDYERFSSLMEDVLPHPTFTLFFLFSQQLLGFFLFLFILDQFQIHLL